MINTQKTSRILILERVLLQNKTNRVAQNCQARGQPQTACSVTAATMMLRSLQQSEVRNASICTCGARKEVLIVTLNEQKVCDPIVKPVCLDWKGW